jgi:hypothetical protein
MKQVEKIANQNEDERDEPISLDSVGQIFRKRRDKEKVKNRGAVLINILCHCRDAILLSGEL